jgi:hypothetical protein
MGVQVDPEVSGLDDAAFFRGRCPAQISTHARQKFVHAERLGNVIIGSEVQRCDLSTLILFHREHDDWHL